MPRDPEFLANEANRLVNEPLLVEALAALEAEAIEAIVAADHTEDGNAIRRDAAIKVSVIRGLGEQLRATIAIGRQAARGRPPVA